MMYRLSKCEFEDLLTAVRLGFQSQSTSLNSYCVNNKIDNNTAREVLSGRRENEELKNQLMFAAGVTEIGGCDELAQ